MIIKIKNFVKKKLHYICLLDPYILNITQSQVLFTIYKYIYSIV